MNLLLEIEGINGIIFEMMSSLIGINNILNVLAG
jgi:hypothetical protein